MTRPSHRNKDRKVKSLSNWTDRQLGDYKKVKNVTNSENGNRLKIWKQDIIKPYPHLFKYTNKV